MVAIRGRTFKRPWRRSCLSSKLKSSSAPIGREDSWCFHAVGSSNAPLLGSTVVEGSQRIGRTSIATRWRSCGLPQSASCSENFVIPPDVFGQTLRILHLICGGVRSQRFDLRFFRPFRADLSIRKSSSFFPPLIAATSQRGFAPRPAQVSPEGLRYFGGTFLPFNVLPPPRTTLVTPKAANC